MGYKRRVTPGVTNTGDAAVGDVASGKVFSSALLTNAAGTSTVNATVPVDAPIQPAQAFVDNIALFLKKMGTASPFNFDLSSKGITKFVVGTASDTIGAALVGYAAIGSITLNLSGNNITDATVINQILADIESLVGGTGNLVIDLSGGTMAAPPVDGGCIGDVTFGFGSTFAASGPGDFFVMPSGEGPFCYWFNVDGGNTQPSVTADHFVEVDISATMADGDVASTMVAIDTSGTGWVLSVGGNTVHFGSTVIGTYTGVYSQTGSGISGSFTQAVNAAKAALIGFGNTVTTN
jgi:hypothetical protein